MNNSNYTNLGGQGYALLQHQLFVHKYTKGEELGNFILNQMSICEAKYDFGEFEYGYTLIISSKEWLTKNEISDLDKFEEIKKRIDIVIDNLGVGEKISKTMRPIENNKIFYKLKPWDITQLDIIGGGLYFI